MSTKKNNEAQMFIEKEQFALQQYQYKWKYLPYNGVNNTKFPPSHSWSSQKNI